MIFNLSNPYEVDKFTEYVNRLICQKSIVELKKRLPNRSLSQNNYLHLILSYFGCELGYNLDEVKYMFFKKTVNEDIFKRKRVNNKGVEVVYYRSTSELTTGEMTTAIDRFRNYSSAVVGVYLPSPNENQMLVYIEQEIERNKEFI